MNIYLIGFMGCGKSYWAKVLSREMNIPSFDMDDIIEDNACESIYDIFYGKGEAYFRQEEQKVVHDLVKLNKGYIIACGGGTPCYQNNIDVLNSNGVTIYLKASEQFLYQRLLNGRFNRPLISMYNNAELKSFIQQTLAEREQYYMQATDIVDAEQVTIPQFIQQVFACINQPK
jgi:shikimate kinase